MGKVMVENSKSLLERFRSIFSDHCVSEKGSNIKDHHVRTYAVDLVFGRLEVRYTWVDGDDFIRYDSSVDDWEAEFQNESNFLGWLHGKLEEKYQKASEEWDNTKWSP